MSKPKSKDDELQEDTRIILCGDCKIIVEITYGSSGKIVEQWGLCERHKAKRNGFIGARTWSDLGVF